MMANRNEYVPGIIAWSAYIGIFVFVYWEVVVCIWRDPTAASWAQAFGTIAAVFGAVWATRFQIEANQEEVRRERRERQYAAGASFSLQLLPLVGPMATVQATRELLADHTRAIATLPRIQKTIRAAVEEVESHGIPAELDYGIRQRLAMLLQELKLFDRAVERISQPNALSEDIELALEFLDACIGQFFSLVQMLPAARGDPALTPADNDIRFTQG